MVSFEDVAGRLVAFVWAQRAYDEQIIKAVEEGAPSPAYWLSGTRANIDRLRNEAQLAFDEYVKDLIEEHAPRSPGCAHSPQP